MRFVRTAENLFGLPQGFTRVEYLESTGTQYIDTGLKMSNDNMTFDGNIMWTDKNATANFFFGYRLVDSPVVTGDMRAFFVYGASASPIGRLAIRYGVNADNSTQAISLNTKYNISWDGSNLKINGTTYDTLSQAYTPASYKSMFLFWCNCENTYSADVGKFVGRIYNWQIKQDGVLVRDFIPCIDPLGVACMYDLVERKSYYNAGTGTFTVGRQVIPVEYLESSGTQRIDTGISTAEGICTEAKFKLNSITSVSQVIFGKVGSTTPPMSRYWFGAQGSSLKWYYAVNEYITTSANADADIHTVVLDTVNNVCTLDGETIATFSDLNGNSETISFFSVFYQGSLNNPMSGRIYYTKIWNNGTLVRDYIPCKDENNVGFMFDKVSGTCYLNAGTGAFSVGEPVYTSKLRLIKDAGELPVGYTRIEYLESTGTQWIDTGYKPNTNTRTVGMCCFNSFVGSNADYVFGVFSSPNNYGLNVGSARQYFNVPWGSSSGIQLNGLIPQTNKDYEFDISKTGYLINRQSYGIISSESVNSNRNMYLFWSNGTSASGMNGRIYYLKIYDNGTLVRSFIPVRDSNNVGYMFDEFTGQLFSNAGSGSFGIGNDLPTAKVRFIQDLLPREYRPLKYLESTGTQFILTGFTPTVNTDFELELSSTKTSTNWTMGCPTWVGVHYKGTEVGITNSSTASFQQYAPYNHDNSRITLKLQGNTVYANGVSLGTITRRAGTLDFALFGYRDVNQGAGLRFTGSIYKCIIWDNGVPVRDFYPALRKSDNKPGMYDRITKQFFVNQGTGEFNYEI